MENNIHRFKRLYEIIAAFTVFYWEAFILLRGRTDNIQRKRATLLRHSLERLGSVFIKFGQLLALRPDYLPITYCNELFFLLENVPPFSKEEVIKTFQKDFKKNPDEVFQTFEYTPLAAASFGQVHKATLKTGEIVAVKVQRPYIQKIVQEDIALMRFLSKITDILPLGENKLFPIVEEFEMWTKEELDYEVEAKYTQEYYENTKDDPRAMFGPKVCFKYSSKRILTTEFIEGITLNKILFAYKNNYQEVLKQLKERKFNRKDVAETILKTSLRQIYLKGYFHADPHPANIIYTKSGRLAYIDFGIFGHLDKRRYIHMRYARTLLYGDTESSFDALLEMCDVSKVKDFAGFKRDHAKIINETVMQFGKGKKDVPPQMMGKVLFQVLQLLQRYHATISPEFMRHFRSIATRESVILHLYPEMKLEVLANAWKNVSIVALIDALPDSLSSEKIQEHLLQWLNFAEKEILQKPKIDVNQNRYED